MREKGRSKKVIILVPVVLFLGFITWFLLNLFEGEEPKINVVPLPEFISGNTKFNLTVSDRKKGLRHLQIFVNQREKELLIFEKKFQTKGLFKRKGLHWFETEFSVDPVELKLAQGTVDLEIRVRDYSMRGRGNGNLSIIEHKMTVDTVPPELRALSRQHYINVGGTGFIVYQSSSDAVESGVFVDNLYFKGFPAGEVSKEGYHVCYFAVPPDIKPNPEIYLWAKDNADNQSKATFHYRLLSKRFRTTTSNITDQFLERILPYFSFYLGDSNAGGIEKFLKLNRDLRKENRLTYYDLRTKTSSEQFWSGAWLRLKNAANMSKFADRREYYYKRKKIDEQVHMGVDLASLANSEVQAANNGRVVFADRLGIYGLTIVLDHGQGLASVYSHLSRIEIKLEQDVKKGEVIGITGQTGLAGGDHLHFGILVGGMFVNPIEWWDSHWIKDNVTGKLDLLNEY